MGKSYREIAPELAKKLRLIMTDVDGTLLLSGEYIEPEVVQAISRLQESGITVGLVSGRSLPRLENLSAFAGTAGPIIAENGGTARLRPGGELLELGYSRRPAVEAMEKLKILFPGALTEKEDNKDRLIDVSFRAEGVTAAELRKHIDGVQLLDSGYMLHLLQEGISKGGTLEKMLERMEYITPDGIMVFGDSATDISLFEKFPHSVMIINPKLTEEEAEPVRRAAGYTSTLACGEGFIEAASYIADLRTGNI